jgi:hypothetical protein
MVAASLLTGCRSCNIEQPKPLPAPYTLVAAPEPLPPFRGETLGDLLSYTVNLRNKYREQSDQLQGLEQWVQQARGAAK